MALFCLHCLDNETDGAALRAAARPAHLEWAGGLGPIVRMAGPRLDSEGRMVGSVFLIEAGSLAAARAAGWAGKRWSSSLRSPGWSRPRA